MYYHLGSATWTPKGNDFNTVAFVKPIEYKQNAFKKIIYVCPIFFQLSKIEKSCAIMHELSHAVVHTNDECYGNENCLKLAKTNPSKASKNADSYDFFTQYLVNNNIIN